MDKFTFRKYISTSELFFSLILILRLFFFIAVVSGNFWAIWSGMLVVCVWRVNVRREPETGSFLIAVPIVIATVDVWLRTRVVFIVYLSIVLTYINSYRIVVSYWFDCFFFCTCYRILSSNLIALSGRGGGTRAIQLGGDARGAWRPSISNSLSSGRVPFSSPFQCEPVFCTRRLCSSAQLQVFFLSPQSDHLANNRASPTHCNNISLWLGEKNRNSSSKVDCVVRWTTCRPHVYRCVCVCARMRVCRCVSFLWTNDQLWRHPKLD